MNTTVEEPDIFEKPKVKPNVNPNVYIDPILKESLVDSNKKFSIYLLNDDYNLIDLVIFAVMTIIECGVDKALNHAVEAHEKGQSYLKSGQLKEMEMIQQMFSGFNIQTKIKECKDDE